MCSHIKAAVSASVGTALGRWAVLGVAIAGLAAFQGFDWGAVNHWFTLALWFSLGLFGLTVGGAVAGIAAQRFGWQTVLQSAFLAVSLSISSWCLWQVAQMGVGGVVTVAVGLAGFFSIAFWPKIVGQIPRRRPRATRRRTRRTQARPATVTVVPEPRRAQRAIRPPFKELSMYGSGSYTDTQALEGVVLDAETVGSDAR